MNPDVTGLCVVPHFVWRHHNDRLYISATKDVVVAKQQRMAEADAWCHLGLAGFRTHYLNCGTFVAEGVWENGGSRKSSLTSLCPSLTLSERYPPHAFPGRKGTSLSLTGERKTWTNRPRGFLSLLHVAHILSPSYSSTTANCASHLA